MSWHEPIAWAAAVVLAVPLLVVAAECLAALPGRRARRAVSGHRPRCAVLIPAHDEEPVIARTLAAVLPQLAPGDRVLVVADNCTDRTAEIARGHGAEVTERSDAVRRGKGYALAHGVAEFERDPPDVVVVLDADCVMADGALAVLVERAAATGRPVQAAYHMSPPAGATAKQQVAAFAFLVKNVVRPLGLSRLGLPCLLTGTGMAFPWAVLRGANLGHGHIVEDMQLAVDLALAGRTVVFAPDAVVRGEFPADDGATASQRKRWEHGHLSVLLNGAPRLLLGGLRRGRPSLLALGLEVGVPPLSALLVGWVIGVVLLGSYGLLAENWHPPTVLFSAGIVFLCCLAATWARHGSRLLPLRSLLRVPFYVLRKVPLYLGFLRRPQMEWVRTNRQPLTPG